MPLQAHLPQAFTPRERTLPAMLERQAGFFGARSLFTCGGETWSFAEARDIAAGMAGAFAAAGLRRGDRVAILCSNRPEFMRAFLGCAWLGLVAVPINAAVKGRSSPICSRTPAPWRSSSRTFLPRRWLRQDAEDCAMCGRRMA